ncbi:MAG TPA: Uma2 family endonuclease [Tepidisphaeraceae bacterium]|nr:Uma2 family endonuclease [Tepidisphaeraceae bacterium]
MTVDAMPALMTTEELLALPDDGTVERDLIAGQLRERPMTRRNPFHAGTEADVAHVLISWLKTQPEPRGKVYSGEVGVRIRANPDTTVGIDVAYFSHEVVAANATSKRILDGAPVLAVEILSPSDQQDDVLEKVGEYLAAGVKLVWVVEPVYRTVTVYRPDREPELFNVTAELAGDAHLPGFRVPVAELFGA